MTLVRSSAKKYMQRKLWEPTQLNQDRLMLNKLYSCRRPCPPTTVPPTNSPNNQITTTSWPITYSQ